MLLMILFACLFVWFFFYFSQCTSSVHVSCFIVFPTLRGYCTPGHLKTLLIFSKNKTTSDNASNGSNWKCSKNSTNHSFISVETMVSTEIKLWFVEFLEHFQLDPFDALSEVVLFFEKISKVFKCPGVQYPLSVGKTIKQLTWTLEVHWEK